MSLWFMDPILAMRNATRPLSGKTWPAGLTPGRKPHQCLSYWLMPMPTCAAPRLPTLITARSSLVSSSRRACRKQLVQPLLVGTSHTRLRHAPTACKSIILLCGALFVLYSDGLARARPQLTSMAAGEDHVNLSAPVQVGQCCSRVLDSRRTPSFQRSDIMDPSNVAEIRRRLANGYVCARHVDPSSDYTAMISQVQQILCEVCPKRSHAVRRAPFLTEETFVLIQQEGSARSRARSAWHNLRMESLRAYFTMFRASVGSQVLCDRASIADVTYEAAFWRKARSVAVLALWALDAKTKATPWAVQCATRNLRVSAL